MNPEDGRICTPSFEDNRDQFFSGKGPLWTNPARPQALLHALGKFRGFAKKAVDLNGIKHLLKKLHPGLCPQIHAAQSLLELSDIFINEDQVRAAEPIHVIRIQSAANVCTQTPLDHSDLVRAYRSEMTTKFSEKNRAYLRVVCPGVARDLIISHYSELELPENLDTEMLFSVALSKLLDYHSANYLQMQAHLRNLQGIVDHLTHGLETELAA